MLEGFKSAVACDHDDGAMQPVGDESNDSARSIPRPRPAERLEVGGRASSPCAPGRRHVDTPGHGFCAPSDDLRDVGPQRRLEARPTSAPAVLSADLGRHTAAMNDDDVVNLTLDNRLDGEEHRTRQPQTAPAANTGPNRTPTPRSHGTAGS